MTPKMQNQVSPCTHLWRLAYARRSFEHVVSICDHLTQTGMDEASPLFYPMTVAAFALYTRPFKRNRVIGRISDQIVPREFLPLHEEIIQMRDQILVHSDADPSVSLGGFPGTSVRLSIGGERDIGVFEMRPRTARMLKIRELAAALVERSTKAIAVLMQDPASQLPTVDGEFEVDLKQQKFVPVMPTRR